MHTVEEMLVEKNYSKCPLKKRPVNYQFEEQQQQQTSEPQDLCLKKLQDDVEEVINVSDCAEDEGVDVDEEEEFELTVDDVEDPSEAKQTQAAALAAAAAVVASVVVPTPTYPWNFHMSPYTAEFYRTINQPRAVASSGSDLISPSSPTDSLGSMSPPPHHYLHGRASSVSPPMRSEIIHRPLRQQDRFLPYPAAAYASAYPSLAYHHHHVAPISPAYSENSFYSLRSLTPESSCSSLPEDLSLKHKIIKTETSSLPLATTETLPSVPAPLKKDKSSQPPRYQCNDCQKSYSTFSGLTKHQQFHCPAAAGNQVKKSFSCKDCDKTYVSLGALKMHIRTHTLPCKCQMCGKAFSRPWLLQGHIRTHTGEKPFSCQHCHRAFADRSNLRAHLQTHSDIKKYSCTSCSKTFSRMSLLTKHSEGGCPGGGVSSGFNEP